jgi:dipeptidyl aminopeptidase/acylaminoacyl peptidase
MKLGASALLTVLATGTLAQGRTAPTPADYGKFEALGAAALSPDGKWLAYTATRVDERTELRVRSLTRDTTITIAIGSSPTFTLDSRWLAYTVVASAEERERLERERKPVRTGLGLLNLTTGETAILGQSTGHRFSPNGRFLAWRAHPIDATKRDAADLLVRDLATGMSQTFGNIGAFAWSERGGALLAMTIETDGHAGNGVHLFDGGTGRLTTLAASADRYLGLTWRRQGDDLAVLRTRVSTAFKDTTHLLLAWSNLLAPDPVRRTLDPDSSAGIPGAMRISEARPPEWSRDGTQLTFGLRPRTPAAAARDSATSRDKASDVQVWHARDVRPIPQQRAQDQQDLRRTLLAVWHPSGQRVVTVGSDLTGTASASDRAVYAVEQLTTAYPFGAMFGRRRVDVDVVHLATGARWRALEGARYFAGASPSGRRLAFFRDGRWLAYDADTRREITLGNAAGDAFVDTDDDHPTDQPGHRGLGGWSSDERWLLAYTKYDVWRLAVDGSSSTRLTNGEADRLVHRIVRLDPRESTVDLTKPVYLAISGEWSKQTGFARLTGDRVEHLVLGDYATGALMKADSAAVMAFTRMRFDTPPNWFVASPDLREPRQVSATNADFGQYAWGKGELVEFTSDSGRRLQGALYYPANYDPSRKYPMIVNTYELLSGAIHQFITPSERTYYNRTVWTAQGYFVFTPDIVFRPGDPGRSYLECLVPAVRSVIAKGVVDSSRVGLIGHSWGGYEATYVPTQTTLFATSIAGAPITNFLSFAGAFHWAPGFPEFDHWETGQARMVKPPWEDLEGHLRNSPAAHVANLQRPMLMMFGDADGTVDWHQGVEFYNFARRAGKDDFVMLVYPGEDHGLRKKENQIDYHRRILEWFGHYLKSEPAPEWMRRGVTWQERKAVAGGKP